MKSRCYVVSVSVRVYIGTTSLMANDSVIVLQKKSPRSYLNIHGVVVALAKQGL